MALTGDAQQAHWLEAARQLENAATHIEFIRGRFIEADPVAREGARLGLVANMSEIIMALISGYLAAITAAVVWRPHRDSAR